MPAFLLDCPRTGTRSHSLMECGLNRAEIPAFQQRPWSLEMYRDPTEASAPKRLQQLLKETKLSVKPTDIPKRYQA